MSLETLDTQNNLDTSVGVVKPQMVVIEQPLKLACGVVLPSHTLVYVKPMVHLTKIKPMPSLSATLLAAIIMPLDYMMETPSRGGGITI